MSKDKINGDLKNRRSVTKNKAKKVEKVSLLNFVADILTFMRLIIDLVLFIMLFAWPNLEAVFVLYMLGELTDAFDGTAAARWPFPKGKIPHYRKYAAKYDMLADAWLAFDVTVFFTAYVNLAAGVAIMVGYGILGLLIEFSVYGKMFGHPDDAKPGSLIHKNFKLAKKLILTRRRIYLACLFTMAVWILFASNFPMGVKIGFLAVGIVVSGFLLIFLAQRRHNISRDAVEIEEKLENNNKY
ncbi:CDP-alcohol phosphatidyltransferase family protein [Candidatus Saccharibacteria bacterium]|nr:CDP-alcohol phosphatidyltransferase family protein [Candidatus Saccharibacteria bacterium]